MRTDRGDVSGIILAVASIVIALLAVLPPLMEAARTLQGSGS